MIVEKNYRGGNELTWTVKRRIDFNSRTTKRSNSKGLRLTEGLNARELLEKEWIIEE
jgi:hypothetical protein